MAKAKKIQNIIQTFSLPLLLGIVVALIWANVDYSSYYHLIEYDLLGGGKFLGKTLTPHFIVNDIFMVLFFGIAAVEISLAFQPGGPLHDLKKAVNPLAATLGGILGPVAIFFLLNIFNYNSLAGYDKSAIINGWAIPTATDIALAWMLARLIFGAKHPAISFLLLLAVGDDAIGLMIIAVFYPSPEYTVEPAFLIINLFAIVIAFVLRKRNVRNVFWYLVLAGIPSWLGLILAHLHPALALVPIVLFLPHNKVKGEKNTPLIAFEHIFKYPVDIGLFFFSFMNAGVVFSSINALTWIILLSLKAGKTVGIFCLAAAAHLAGFKLPGNITKKELVVIGLIAGLGLTVSLFIAGEAYQDSFLQGGAKMGALLSLLVIPAAGLMAKIIKIKKQD